jgi:hypothetical protein
MPSCNLTAPVLSITIAMGGTMIDVTQEVNVSLPAVESAQTGSETEAKLTGEIKSLWTAHRTNTATAKETKEELEALRFDLGEKLREMKAILARTGRSGGWAAYLRSHALPRASAERYIKQYETIFNPQKNRLTDTLSEPSADDVRRLVRSLLPRLRRVLTAPKSVSLFVDEVAQQLQASVADISAGKIGTSQVDMGTSHGPVVTKVHKISLV